MEKAGRKCLTFNIWHCKKKLSGGRFIIYEWRDELKIENLFKCKIEEYELRRFLYKPG